MGQGKAPGTLSAEQALDAALAGTRRYPHPGLAEIRLRVLARGFARVLKYL